MRVMRVASALMRRMASPMPWVSTSPYAPSAVAGRV